MATPKKTKIGKDLGVITFKSDDFDVSALDAMKKKFEKAIGKSGDPCAIFGISEKDSLEITTLNLNGKETIVVTIKGNDVEDSFIDSVEESLKQKLGHSNVVVFSILPSESLEFQTIRGE